MTTDVKRNADLRDYLAAERTFLAWVRTGLALMGFGFVVEMVSSVYLVKALGGGWDASQLKDEQVHPHAGQVLQQ